MFIQEPPSQAIVSLQESRYGYSLVDLNLSAADLADFNQIAVEKELFYSSFGPPPLEELSYFLVEIGPNEPQRMQRVAQRIIRIAEDILQASKRETVWVTLRSFTPTSRYDMPRWHIDGQYYFQEQGEKEMQYRLAFSLLGPPTLLYPLPSESKELRKMVWIRMADRKWMAELFPKEKAFSPHRNEAVLMIGGSRQQGALHSEPPIHEERLFLSIIPCNKKDLTRLNGFTPLVIPKLVLASGAD